jgi:hypothetical protein
MKCEKMVNIYAMNRVTIDDAGLQERHGRNPDCEDDDGRVR